MENENKPVNWDNHEDSQAEEFRRQLLNEAERNRLLMKTIQDLQKQVYDGYQRIKELGLKICLVSPELQGHSIEKIKEFRNIILDNNFQIEAICTKYYNIDLWKYGY